ncbi:hypothetical protein XO10_08075 [Marinitoga sp. 1135]|uniref:Putative metal-binding protein, possibly nucleic-acid binding protein n=1 Tax=Marinitoga piezophila (strain DSM 14283 / JCM 11233 / KA3) TaxID=443254 RepID=H2J511_MARPK|nr:MULTISPECIES: DUF177 domain-containing protein [Marinitoga]AEX86028.1 putative metal-binding protein, possibly nucleic-acid binding protein [Marinitoga piezophila KA3]APT76452.1 hypothetical protein LN42_08735 [Marinitoga sp. 1137]NUU96214.1 hypothetical protein [Marinitoga sp. 1135]NUU98137.1 hypothetical protein [Marinitoga sp. 1138]
MLNDKLHDQKLIYDLDKIEEKEEYTFEITWEKLDTPEGVVDIVKPIKIQFDITKTSQGYILKGNLKTTVKLVCSRCLKEYEQDINGEIEAYYIDDRLQDIFTKNEKLETLDNIIFYSDMKVDITDRIIEAIMMEIPEKPLCKEDCKGLCPICGIDLNENPDHKHEEQYIDPRMAKLLDIFGDEE